MMERWLKEAVTDIQQSRALDAIARKIEQVCPAYNGDGYQNDITDASYPCSPCSGLGKVYPYIRSGIDGWLRQKKGSEWPGLVWVKFLGELNPNSAWELKSYECEPLDPYFHSLELLDAFTLLEEVTRGYWERTKAVVTNKDIYTWFDIFDNEQFKADSPEELLDKILAGKVKA